MSIWDYIPPEQIIEPEEEELLAALPEPAPEWLPLGEPLVEAPPEPTAPGQETLFGSDDEFTLTWPEWKGMPEFMQEDLTAWKSVLVNFESRLDMDAFAKLVGQNLTSRTRSIWYPEAEIGHFIDKRYRDVS